MNAIRSVVNQFLRKFKSSKCQVVNLGAGYDTLYMNLIDQNNIPTKYIEIDFPRVVSSKIRLIRSKKNLAEKFEFKTELPEPNQASTTKPVETTSSAAVTTPMTAQTPATPKTKAVVKKQKKASTKKVKSVKKTVAAKKLTKKPSVKKQPLNKTKTVKKKATKK